MTMFTLFGINAAGWLVTILAAALLTWMLAFRAGKQTKKEPVRYLDDTERALEVLEFQLETGRIGAEEYRARRAALLNRR